MVSQSEREAVLAICLMAALADGTKDQAERERLKQVFESLDPTSDNAAYLRVYQRVILQQTSLAHEAATLSTPQVRTLAYEMAVAVCDADGESSSQERDFLSRLASSLGLDASSGERIRNDADRLASELFSTATLAAPVPAAMAPGTPAVATARQSGPSQTDQDVQGTIRTYAVLCAAMELLPQTMASMGIIPAQMKMVHSIGSRYGHSLSMSSIKEFAAVLGIGAASQVLEGYARKALGGLLGSVGKGLLGKTGGKLLKSAGATGAGAAMTFATTYALGQVARQYFAGGRSLSAIDLKSMMSRETTNARQLYEAVRPEIEQRAASMMGGSSSGATSATQMPMQGLDPGSIVNVLRGRLGL